MSKDETNPKDLEGNKKSPISLVPASAIIYLAEAFKEGARKYGAYNWRTKKVQTLIYCDAIMRHLLAYIDGEDIDKESGKHHLSGVLASAAVLIDATETGNLIDNRPTKGKASEILSRNSTENLQAPFLTARQLTPCEHTSNKLDVGYYTDHSVDLSGHWTEYKQGKDDKLTITEFPDSP